MKTHQIFACLKPGYKAVCNENKQAEVFYNEDKDYGHAVFYQVDEFGISVKFKPENYPDATWRIVSL
ncbi:hypothetical protein PP175_28500 (plasmid) [Aneurinibacillus sp. Ricciae_BoGa-3]|uniref:hypothetical protein n=1 Tax=Aneurinibacillus sp. Ricciae_BoGa-3 TaxID=3022697 RepID=UPI0023421F10|nr:hypothetical protein [Aneurinibacillus sp. Ricciae_BoGa-3]WCK57132.1 hypothetical protein PP175_28500 [Aneurinibacillus sp. Ricciae_BoGa-3]